MMSVMVATLTSNNIELKGWDDGSVSIWHEGKEIGYIENGEIHVWKEPR